MQQKMALQLYRPREEKRPRVSLLQMPAEIRALIFNYVYTDRDGEIFELTGDSHERGPFFWRDAKEHFAPARVCRVMRAECRALAFRSIVFPLTSHTQTTAAAVERRTALYRGLAAIRATGELALVTRIVVSGSSADALFGTQRKTLFEEHPLPNVVTAGIDVGSYAQPHAVADAVRWLPRLRSLGVFIPKSMQADANVQWLTYMLDSELRRSARIVRLPEGAICRDCGQKEMREMALQVGAPELLWRNGRQVKVRHLHMAYHTTRGGVNKFLKAAEANKFCTGLEASRADEYSELALVLCSSNKQGRFQPMRLGTRPVAQLVNSFFF